MARVLRQLADGGLPRFPGLQVPGWWRKERRATSGTGRAFEMRAGPRAAAMPQPLMIVGDGGAIAGLVVAACEARGLHSIVSGQDDRQAIHSANPCAVLDTRGDAPADAAAALGAVCSAQEIIGAFIVPTDHEAEPPASGLLVANTGPIFTPEDEAAPLWRLLVMLDGGHPVDVRRSVPFDAVYGPCLIDCILDLLLDGATGTTCLLPAERLSEAEIAAILATVAGRPVELLQVMGEATPSSSPPVTSYLPPTETMVERFVRDRRATQRQERARLAQGEFDQRSAAE